MIRVDHARVFDGERVRDGVSVLIDGGLVVAVTPTARPGATADGPATGTAGVTEAAGAVEVTEVIDGTGHTLLPGLIDGHTHVMGTLYNLRLALAFGVTTELDLFSFPPALTGWLRDTAARTDDVADLRSSGTVMCATGGHPAASMPFLPTLAGPQDAREQVTARRKEGAHCIKMMLDDGGHHGADLPTLDGPTASAVTAAARREGLLTVAHIADAETVRAALAAGADAFTHVPMAAPLPADLVARTAADGRFVIPTLAMMEMSSGARGGRGLADDDRVGAHLPADAAAAIRTGTEGLAVTVPSPDLDFAHALGTTRRLHEAGVTLVAGTDANNAPGRACPVVHGAALHRELELLVAAGLTPVEALRAATSAPARLFGLSDRGRIAPGLRADLLLVEGDPTTDITATRAIRRIWRRGVPFDREGFRTARQTPARPAPRPAAPGARTPDTNGTGPGRRGGGTTADSELTAVGSTALALAAARARESGRPDRLFDDPVATQVAVAAGAALAAWSGPRGERLRRAMGDYFALRTRYFDNWLLDAVGSGCRQVVVLAAGLDARAFRLDWPAPLRLFELDRADVLSFKEKIVTGRAPAPGCVRIPMAGDLRDDWPRTLRAHGFDPRVPTAWLLEGILVYLTEQEGDEVLARVGELSAPASRLALEYGSRAMFATDTTRAALDHAAATDTLHTLSALWRNESTADPVARLTGHGWSARSREITDLAARYERPVPPAFDPTVPGSARIALLQATRT
ncbi:SAM-dependent methyltransferase [Streptomyces fagopyri]|uniref:SAM-dependent methyltransferase n=1 Tax=Streptomyces fagopyri TaxID=2662397 RepID=UPI003828D79A